MYAAEILTSSLRSAGESAESIVELKYFQQSRLLCAVTFSSNPSSRFAAGAIGESLGVQAACGGALIVAPIPASDEARAQLKESVYGTIWEEERE